MGKGRDRPAVRAVSRRIAQSKAGVAMVEFALLLPIFLTLLFGILTYGHYYYLAHTLQQLANDAARATLGGLTTGERSTLAQQSVTGGIVATPFVKTRMVVQTTDDTPFVRVSVRYDASDFPLFKTSLVPVPDPVIQRTAAVRMGGL